MPSIEDALQQLFLQGAGPQAPQVPQPGTPQAQQAPGLPPQIAQLLQQLAQAQPSAEPNMPPQGTPEIGQLLQQLAAAQRMQGPAPQVPTAQSTQPAQDATMQSLQPRMQPPAALQRPPQMSQAPQAQIGPNERQVPSLLQNPAILQTIAQSLMLGLGGRQGGYMALGAQGQVEHQRQVQAQQQSETEKRRVTNIELGQRQQEIGLRGSAEARAQAGEQRAEKLFPGQQEMQKLQLEAARIKETINTPIGAGGTLITHPPDAAHPTGWHEIIPPQKDLPFAEQQDADVQKAYADMLGIPATRLTPTQKEQARQLAKAGGSTSWVGAFVQQNKRFPLPSEILDYEKARMEGRIPPFTMGQQAIYDPDTGNFGIPVFNRRTGKYEVTGAVQGPTTQERTMAGQGTKISALIDEIIPQIDANAADLGGIVGRGGKIILKAGYANKPVSKLYTNLNSLAAMQGVIHGMRGGEQLYKLMMDSIGNIQRNPESLKGSLEAIKGLAMINQQEGRFGSMAIAAGAGTEAKPTTPATNDPLGIR